MADYKILTIPFARDAVPDMVNDIPEAPSPSEPQLASYRQGFPVITTLPREAGGLPPEGQDFNGILRDITEHIVHQNKGGMYKFAPEVVAAGGYAKGAVLASNDNLSLWVSLQNNNVQDFNTGTPTQWARIAFSGLDTLLNEKADKAVSINAGTGLTGGGTLAANRTLSVSYGTTAGTAAQGNDSRITGAAQKSANLSDLTNVATAITNLGLGTAATKNAQTSPTDTTAGALMAVGAFGLGGGNAYITNTDLNALSKTGFYIGGGLVNAPLASVDWFYVLHQQDPGANYASQIAIALNAPTPKTYQRQKTGGTWASWYDVWNSSTLPVTAFAKTLLDDADAAAARATLDVYSKVEANGIAIGVGQTWQNVTAQRAANTTYTNTTGKPILVHVQKNSGQNVLTLTVDSLQVSRFGGYGIEAQAAVTAIVPNGSTYIVGGSGSISYWVELR